MRIFRAPGAWPGRQAALFAAPLFAAAAAILFVRIVLGFQFPVPWPDETGFIAPAFDLARTGSFFDPGMNPDRVVMWMPPGYMVLLAGLFRVAGYSFALVRWVSTLLCLASLALCAGVAWRLTQGWPRVLAAWILAAAFVSPFMLADANIGRMDMLLACMVLLALACAVSGRLYVACACAAAGMVVHFNAGYFALPLALALADAAWRRRLPRPDAIDIAAAAAAFLALALYAVQVARNWPGFQADVGFQFELKRFFGHDDPAHPAWPPLAGAVLVALSVWRARRLDEAGICALFGAAFLVMAHNGHEIWYDYAQPLGFALIAVALLSGRLSGPMPRWQWAPAALAALLVLVFSARMTDSMRPLLPHRAMLHRSFIAPAEIAKVRAFIATLKPGATVNFGWSGIEPFFFADLARSGARWTIIRHSVTQVFPFRSYDWRVRCDSSEWPPALFKYDIDVPRVGKDTGCDIIAARDAAGH